MEPKAQMRYKTIAQSLPFHCHVYHKSMIPYNNKSPILNNKNYSLNPQRQENGDHVVGMIYQILIHRVRLLQLTVLVRSKYIVLQLLHYRVQLPLMMLQDIPILGIQGIGVWQSHILQVMVGICAMAV